MAEHVGIFNRIRNKIVAVMITVEDFMGYDQVRVYNTLPANAFVTRGMIDQLIPSGGSGYPVPFTNVTGFAINWQTDNVPGVSGQTYQAAFGGIPNPFVYFGTIGNPYTPAGQPFTWTTDSSGNILVMTFDWGTSQSGYIRF